MHDLSVEEIEQVAESFKQDMQRDVNRMVRRHNTQGALAALEAIEYIDKLIMTLKLRAGSELHKALLRPARARPIHLSPRIINRK